MHLVDGHGRAPAVAQGDGNQASLLFELIAAPLPGRAALLRDRRRLFEQPSRVDPRPGEERDLRGAGVRRTDAQPGDLADCRDAVAGRVRYRVAERRGREIVRGADPWPRPGEDRDDARRRPGPSGNGPATRARRPPGTHRPPGPRRSTDVEAARGIEITEGLAVSLSPRSRNDSLQHFASRNARAHRRQASGLRSSSSTASRSCAGLKPPSTTRSISSASAGFGSGS